VKKTNQTTVLNWLTGILIVVTVFSIIATVGIVSVSVYLEKMRQRENIVFQIEQIDKLIIELENNQETASRLYIDIDSMKNNTEIPNVKLFHIRIDSVPELVKLNNSLLNETEKYKVLIEAISRNIENVQNNNPNAELKNDSIDRTKQNLNLFLNGGRVNGQKIEGVPDLISKLKDHQLKLKQKISEINNNKMGWFFNTS